MAQILLSVSPETLRRTALEMMDTLRSIRVRAARIRDVSVRTRGYWQGDSGEQDRSGYALCAEELLDAARRLENRSVILMKLAGVYEETDRAVADANANMRTEQVLTR